MVVHKNISFQQYTSNTNQETEPDFIPKPPVRAKIIRKLNRNISLETKTFIMINGENQQEHSTNLSFTTHKGQSGNRDRFHRKTPLSN